MRGCMVCARHTAGIRMAQGDLANYAHKLTRAQSDVKVKYWLTAVGVAKRDIANSREWLTDHLGREHEEVPSSVHDV